MISNNLEFNELKGARIHFIDIQNLNFKWPEFFEISDGKRNFRDNFWFSTKARLYVIPIFMEIYSIQKIIHLENDVWIHPEFPFHIFEYLDYPLAFPRVDSERAIASILFINGSEGRRLLLDSCEKWPMQTDMQILGKLILSQKNVCELPSTYGGVEEHFDGWIFDGAKLGMYLFGSDPRNTYGLVKRFDFSPLGSVGTKFKLKLTNKVLFLQDEVKERKIANLHIHSKNISMFSYQWDRALVNQLRKRSLRLSLGFDLRAFFFVIQEMTHRVLRKLGKK